MSKLLTTEQAAEYLGYSAATLNQSRSKSSGVIGGRPAPKHYKIGVKLVRYKEEDLKKWLECAGVISEENEEG